jgi:transposase
MEDLLVDSPPIDVPADLRSLVRQLQHEVLHLSQEVAKLRCENIDLRRQANYWKSVHARAVQRAEQLEAKLQQVQAENSQLKAEVFGRKTEKSASTDRSNQLEGEFKFRPRKRGQRKNNPGPQRRNYDHLPMVEELYELSEDRRRCPECGSVYSPINTEGSEQIEIDVRAYRRLIRRRRYQRKCRCQNSQRTITALAPPKLIPKGLLGISVWLEILLEKFFSYRPLERLLEHWRLLGLDVAAGTVAGGLQRLEPLFEPLHQALLQRNALSPITQADETRWMVFIDQQGKTGHRWWLWVFLGADTVVFRLDPSRSHNVPEGHFPAQAEMVLVVDRYAAYKAMAQVQSGQVTLAFCWAHVRRDFVKLGKGWPERKNWALDWLHRIRKLYLYQRRRLTHEPGSTEYVTADTALRNLVAKIHDQARSELTNQRLPASCHKALDSLLEHWEGLTRFVDDLRIPLDNNGSERQIRGPALGRKNYYGSGALWSGRLAAMLFSLFATLRLSGINARKWLKWYLESSAQDAGRAPAEVTPYLPWNMSHEKRLEMAVDPDDSS